jgi:hypothetical protein
MEEILQISLQQAVFADGGGIYGGAGRKILDRVGNSGTFHILMLPASRITER